MIIYDQEVKDGIAEKVYASTSIAYQIPLLKASDNDKSNFTTSIKNIDAIVKSSVNDSDLYFTKSILVTTNWNKNDDVFGPMAVWAARHTPSHKRTNLEHDESQLVGHITDTWALDSEGDVIPDNTPVDQLPDLYHIANGAVIYTNWEDEALIERTRELIEKIESGEKFVSMEALFTDFDYAMIENGKTTHSIVARCKDTSFLTKHLRAYGGSGEFNGFKVGRMPKNITFCGKAYVDRPANPDSIIFSNDSIPFSFSTASLENPFIEQNGVSIRCSDIPKKENILMSDIQDVLKAENTELKGEVKELKAQVEELTKASTTEKTKALETQISELNTKLETSAEEVKNLSAKVEEVTKAKEDVEKQLTEANETKTKLEAEIAEAEAAKTKANRISVLVEAGYTTEEATAKVEPFVSFNDDQFNAVAEELVKARDGMKNDKDKDKKDKEKTDAGDTTEDTTTDDSGEAAAASTDLGEAQSEDGAEMNANASESDASTSELDEVRAELSKAFANARGQDVETEE